MSEPDTDPARVHGPPARVRWPEHVADALKGVPLMGFVMPFLGFYNWATHLAPLVEVAIGLGEMAVSVVLIVVLKVRLLRAGRCPKRSVVIVANMLLLQPAWAGMLLMLDFDSPPMNNLLDQMGLNTWTGVVVLLIAMLLCFGLVSWLLIVIARRATAYILPTAPPSA